MLGHRYRKSGSRYANASKICSHLMASQRTILRYQGVCFLLCSVVLKPAKGTRLETAETETVDNFGNAASGTVPHRSRRKVFAPGLRGVRLRSRQAYFSPCQTSGAPGTDLHAPRALPGFGAEAKRFLPPARCINITSRFGEKSALDFSPQKRPFPDMA